MFSMKRVYAYSEVRRILGTVSVQNLRGANHLGLAVRPQVRCINEGNRGNAANIDQTG